MIKVYNTTLPRYYEVVSPRIKKYHLDTAERTARIDPMTPVAKMVVRPRGWVAVEEKSAVKHHEEFREKPSKHGNSSNVVGKPAQAKAAP